jgi:hypothetical protein
MREVFVHFQKKLSVRRLARPIAFSLVPHAMLWRWWPIIAEWTHTVTVRSTTWTTARRSNTPRSIAAWIDAQIGTLRTTTIAASVTTHALVFTRSFTWRAIGLHDLDIIVFVMPRLRDCLSKFCNSGSSDTHMGFVRCNPDGTNVAVSYTHLRAHETIAVIASAFFW